MSTDRRTFLKLIGASAFAVSMPPSIGKALAVPADRRTGTIDDVKHIVFFMQENRSFDHYFGTLRGVRGFADPRAVTLPSGEPVWYQRTASGELLLPFRPDVPDVGMAFLPDPPHGWNDTHDALDGGRHDRWVPNKGIDTMTYHTRADLLYQYALADAFTVCDAYHCSALASTDPNRYHMWTGWVGNDGAAGGPVIDNAEAGYDWSTYPERLERNGISWKVYQDIGDGLTAEGSWGWTGDKPYVGNYGDNSLLYFHQYQNAPAGSALANGAKVGTDVPNDPAFFPTFFDMFRADVESSNLPSVSWIVAPEAFSEHPNWAPDFGSWYVSQVIDILASNPDVFSKTVLFLTYDEEGGFFDHMVPPTPPMSSAVGASTADIVNEIFPGDATRQVGPYGLGMRVPMIVVSPWSKGGWVNSQLFDHTSLIRFVEARFARGNPDLVEGNITPWRRAVVGDLTSTFDFKHPNTRRVRLPDTSALKPKTTDFYADLDVVPPVNQSVPHQENGMRPARALPYELDVASQVDSTGTIELAFINTGAATAVLHVRSSNPTDAPRSYTVEPGLSLTGEWAAASSSAYDLAVYGPNGFFRRFEGNASEPHARLGVRARDGRHGDVSLVITNPSGQQVEVTVHDHYSGKDLELTIGPGRRRVRDWPLGRTHHWYDFTITVASDPSFEYRVAGHVEDGRDSASDPAISGLVLKE